MSVGRLVIFDKKNVGIHPACLTAFPCSNDELWYYYVLRMWKKTINEKRVKYTWLEFLARKKSFLRESRGISDKVRMVKDSEFSFVPFIYWQKIIIVNTGAFAITLY